jgi:hypothetical protein
MQGSIMSAMLFASRLSGPWCCADSTATIAAQRERD